MSLGAPPLPVAAALLLLLLLVGGGRLPSRERKPPAPLPPAEPSAAELLAGFLTAILRGRGDLLLQQQHHKWAEAC